MIRPCKFVNEIKKISFREVLLLPKKIVDLFFERSSEEGNGKDIGFFITFVFWGIILFVNAINELFFKQTFISSSFAILILGLIVFFVSEFIAEKIKK